MTRTKNKKAVMSILLAALMLVVTIGGTLAYLSSTTAETKNTFTFVSGDGVAINLTEPAFVAANALNLTPGKAVAKDPTINSTGKVPSYVAMQVQFVKGDETTLDATEYAKLMGLITINYNTTNWTAASTPGATTIYNYNTSIKGSGMTPAPSADECKTVPLFTSVTINADISNADMTWLSGLNGFKIIVKGAAIQTEGFENLAAAKADLNGLFA